MAADKDDLLDPSEIEELLKAAGAFGTAGGPAFTPPTSVPPATAGASMHHDEPTQAGDLHDGAATDILSNNEIEALLARRDQASSSPPPLSAFGDSGLAPDELLNRAQQGLASAMSPNLAGRGPARPAPAPPRPPKPPPDQRLAEARPFQFQLLEDPADGAEPAALDALEEVELDLRIELGRAVLLIEDVLKLREGSVVPLDKLAGDPVDILVNGRLVARGEVLVLNDNFCVRVAEILAPTS